MTNYVVATGWTSEQWATLIVIGCSSFGSMVVAIVVALKGNAKINAVHNEVRPPSNGRTLAALVEGQAVKGSMIAQDYVQRVEAAKAGEPPPPVPVIPTSLTPTVDDPTLVKRVEAGVLDDRRKDSRDGQ